MPDSPAFKKLYDGEKVLHIYSIHYTSKLQVVERDTPLHVHTRPLLVLYSVYDVEKSEVNDGISECYGKC
jgi:hypothetical protein